MSVIIDEIDLPAIPQLELSGGPRFQTQVTKTNSGYRYANANWKYALWTVRIRFVKRSSTMQALIAFWLARGGPARPFRVLDPHDYTDNGWGQVIIDDDGNYRLAKVYPDDIRPYTRLITRPIAGTVTLSGVAKSGGGFCTADDVDYTTGIVASATSTGTATYQFKIPVAFNSDVVDVSYKVGDLSDWAEIEVEEVRI